MLEAERERRKAENAKREADAKFEREKREVEIAMREAEAKLEREKLESMERIEAQKRKIEKEAREAAREALKPRPLSVRLRQKLSVISAKLKSFLSVKN